MVCPSPIGNALSSYATSSNAESRKKWRGILLIAASTASSLIPFERTISVSLLRNPLCRYVSSVGLIRWCNIEFSVEKALQWLQASSYELRASGENFRLRILTISSKQVRLEA